MALSVPQRKRNILSRLLAAGADVNVAAEYDGRTALEAAAGGGHLDVVERLLAAKADVGSSRRTALQAATNARAARTA
jgi:ankyrin repeat protein